MGRRKAVGKITRIYENGHKTVLNTLTLCARKPTCCAFLTYFSPESSATPATSPTTGAQATLHNDKQSIAGFKMPNMCNHVNAVREHMFQVVDYPPTCWEFCLCGWKTQLCKLEDILGSPLFEIEE
uniref:HDC10048 n=1 Tax=Drosophila melanogaster TaxID=7227 RepID=Q6IL82_DROME|nr:TPA_inf: HDC10048 [Drosophila melanogaster]